MKTKNYTFGIGGGIGIIVASLFICAQDAWSVDIIDHEKSKKIEYLNTKKFSPAGEMIKYEDKQGKDQLVESPVASDTPVKAKDDATFLPEGGYPPIPIPGHFPRPGHALPPEWGNWTTQQKADWLKAELFSGNKIRIRNAQWIFGSLTTQEQAGIIGSLIPANNPDVNSDGYKAMNQLFQSLSYDKKSALIQALSKDTYDPTAAVHLLKNVDAATRDKLFVDLAKEDSLAASRILANWTEGTDSGSAIYDMFKAVLDNNARVAYRVLRALDADSTRAYVADKLRAEFNLPKLSDATVALLQHDGSFFNNGWLTFGLYYRDPTTNQIVKVQLYDAHGNQIKDLQSVLDSLPADAVVGYYLENSHSGDIWYTDKSLNSDGFDHFRVENNSDGSITFKIEDLKGGGDKDFNDYVIQVKNVIQPDEIPKIIPATAALIQHDGDFFRNGWLTFGAYYKDPTTNQIVKIQLFDAHGNQIKDLQSVIDSLPEGAVLGYYLENSHSGDTWYTDTSLNSDGFDHFRVEQNSDGSTTFKIEDLRGGGDKDFNDYVVRISNAQTGSPTPIPGPSPIPEPIPGPPIPIPGPEPKPRPRPIPVPPIPGPGPHPRPIPVPPIPGPGPHPRPIPVPPIPGPGPHPRPIPEPPIPGPGPHPGPIPEPPIPGPDPMPQPIPEPPIPGPDPMPQPIPEPPIPGPGHDPIPKPIHEPLIRGPITDPRDPFLGPIADSMPAVSRSLSLVYQDMKDRFKVDITNVTLLSLQYVEWPDASLGLSHPTDSFSQGITPGYKIIAETDGRRFEYHTDLGNKALLATTAELGHQLLYGNSGILEAEFESGLQL